MNQTTCRWPDCNVVDIKAHGLCRRDYARALRQGKGYEAPWETWRNRRTRSEPRAGCRWPDCNSESRARGFCRTHWAAASRCGNFDDPWIALAAKVCEECGATFHPTRMIQRAICSKACSHAKWKRDNPTKVRENAARYQRENHAAILARVKAWRDDNPETVRQAGRMYAARRRAITHGADAERFGLEDIPRAEECYLCGVAIDYELRHPAHMSPSVDHIVALASGGGHSLSNVAFTHLICNIRKNAQPAERVTRKNPSPRDLQVVAL